MQRTPEEIKKGLECCVARLSCEGCPYYTGDPSCLGKMRKDLFFLIQQLERERDAAVKCIPRDCGYCKHVIDYGPSNAPGCKNSECRNISGINTGWQWRGAQEVE
jgi:hypothetical protein